MDRRHQRTVGEITAISESFRDKGDAAGAERFEARAWQAQNGQLKKFSDGDDGAGVSSPAVSPYVTAVGGTTLRVDAGGRRLSETAWSRSGGGSTFWNSGFR